MQSVESIPGQHHHFTQAWEHVIITCPHHSLWDINAITSSYTLINIYLFQFDYKKDKKPVSI